MNLTAEEIAIALQTWTVSYLTEAAVPEKVINSLSKQVADLVRVKLKQ